MTATVFRAVLLASLVLLPPLALLGSPAATVALCLNAAAALAVILPRGRAIANADAMPDRWMLAAVFALPVVGLASAPWSLGAGESVFRALKLLLLVAAGLAVVTAAPSDHRPAGPLNRLTSCALS